MRTLFKYKANRFFTFPRNHTIFWIFSKIPLQSLHRIAEMLH